MPVTVNSPLTFLLALIVPDDDEPSPHSIVARKWEAGSLVFELVKLATVAVNDFWNFSLSLVPVTIRPDPSIRQRGSSISAAGRRASPRARPSGVDLRPPIPSPLRADHISIEPMIPLPRVWLPNMDENGLESPNRWIVLNLITPHHRDRAVRSKTDRISWRTARIIGATITDPRVCVLNQDREGGVAFKQHASALASGAVLD